MQGNAVRFDLILISKKVITFLQSLYQSIELIKFRKLSSNILQKVKQLDWGELKSKSKEILSVLRSMPSKLKEIDWNKLKQWCLDKLTKKPKNDGPPGLLGMCFTNHGVALAYITESEQKRKSNCRGYIYFPSRDVSEKKQKVLDFIKEHNIEGCRVCYVLHRRDYTLSMAEAPNVESDELAQAMRWLVKEMIDYPLNEAVIDAFKLPLKRANDDKSMAYVVVMQQKRVDEIENLISELGLKLKYIDIPEMSLRNLATLHDLENGALFMRAYRNGGQLILTKNKLLFLARTMELQLQILMQDNSTQQSNKDQASSSSDKENGEGFGFVEEDEPEANDKKQDALDQLTLDVQRSLDYCQSLFRQIPVKKILVGPSELEYDKIEPFLQENVGLEVVHLDLNHYVEFHSPISNADQAECLLAMGGALRDSV